MRGPSQFQQFTILSPSFPGEVMREESPSSPLRDSRAGHRFPVGPLWPLTGSPQDLQQDWRRFTDEERGVDANEAVAGRIVTTGVVVRADTTETVALEGEEAAGEVAGEEAIGAEAAVVMSAAEAKAGEVTTGAVIEVEREEELGVEDADFDACCAAW